MFWAFPDSSGFACCFTFWTLYFRAFCFFGVFGLFEASTGVNGSVRGEEEHGFKHATPSWIPAFSLSQYPSMGKHWQTKCGHVGFKRGFRTKQLVWAWMQVKLPPCPNCLVCPKALLEARLHKYTVFARVFGALALHQASSRVAVWFIEGSCTAVISQASMLSEGQEAIVLTPTKNGLKGSITCS